MSTCPFAAYHLIKDDLKGFSKELMEFPPCQSWIHESVVAIFIGLPIGNEHGQSEALTALLECLKNGWGGDKEKGTQVFTERNPVDLQQDKNGSGVCYQTWGKKEPFKSGKDSVVPLMRSPRWFKFGNGDIPDLGAQIGWVNRYPGAV